MKVSDVPQDGKVAFGDTTRVYYAVDEQGKIISARSTGCDVENAAVTSLMSLMEEQAAEAKERCRQGLSSPVEYYMLLSGLDLAQLAQHMGLSKRTVRAHMKPEVFAKLDHETIARYADLFRIQASELTNLMKEKA